MDRDGPGDHDSGGAAGTTSVGGAADGCTATSAIAGAGWRGLTQGRFETLVRLYEPRLRKLALLRCKGRVADADDLVGTALLHAWRARETYVEKQNPMAWFARILNNALVSQWRRKVRRPEELSDRLDRIPEPLPGDEPWWMDITMDQFHTALAELPASLREPYVLFVFERRPQDEIASQLAISRVAVAGRVFKARARLRELLSHLHPDPEGLPL